MAQMQGQDLGGAQGQVRRKTLLEQQAEWNNPAQFAGLLSDRATSLRRRKEREPILALVKEATTSELWTRMRASDMALVEVPFSHKIDSDGIARVVSGVIDLAFKEPDGWIIADFKSDIVNGNLKDLTEYYRPQVDMYAEYWAEISGQVVKEKGFYFTDIQRWISI